MWWSVACVTTLYRRTQFYCIYSCCYLCRVYEDCSATTPKNLSTTLAVILIQEQTNDAWESLSVWSDALGERQTAQINQTMSWRAQRTLGQLLIEKGFNHRLDWHPLPGNFEQSTRGQQRTSAENGEKVVKNEDDDVVCSSAAWCDPHASFDALYNWTI